MFLQDFNKPLDRGKPRDCTILAPARLFQSSRREVVTFTVYQIFFLGKALFRDLQAQNCCPNFPSHNNFHTIIPEASSTTDVSRSTDKSSSLLLVPPPYILLCYLFLYSQQPTTQWPLHKILPQTWYLSWQRLFFKITADQTSRDFTGFREHLHFSCSGANAKRPQRSSRDLQR